MSSGSPVKVESHLICVVGWIVVSSCCVRPVSNSTTGSGGVAVTVQMILVAYRWRA